MAQQIGSSTTDRQFESSSDDDDEEDSEWMADRHSFQPTATVPSSTSRLVRCKHLTCCQNIPD